tara:strand:- start:248 stop:436 length:189 start_codon:yes stop_codon:yes gene_type:complete
MFIIAAGASSAAGMLREATGGDAAILGAGGDKFGSGIETDVSDNDVISEGSFICAGGGGGLG